MQKPNVFQKVYNYIKHLYKMATAGSTEARQLEQLKYKFEKAYNKNVSNNNNADTKYSLTDNQVSITDEVNDIHSGETFGTMSAKINGEVVGTIEYSEYNGTPSVKMIEIKPEYRRRGIATKLLQELQKKYPDQEIDFGMSTEDGTKLIENVTYQVENKEYVKTQKQLEKVNNRINEIETNNVWNDNIDTEYYKLLDKQRKLDKKLFDLEVDGKNAKKTFVKLDNTKPTSNPDIRYSLSKDTNNGFYSQLERTITNKMQNSATADSVLNLIKNNGVKQDELNWTGIEEYLQEKGNEKVTKQEVLDYIKANQLEIEEVELGDSKVREAKEPIEREIARINREIEPILNKYDIHHDAELKPIYPDRPTGILEDYMVDSLRTLVDLEKFAQEERLEINTKDPNGVKNSKKVNTYSLIDEEGIFTFTVITSLIYFLVTRKK